MIGTGRPDELDIDWDALDEVIGQNQEKAPDGAITTADIMVRYNIQRSAAKSRMDIAVQNGWAGGKFLSGGVWRRYILPPTKEKI